MSQKKKKSEPPPPLPQDVKSRYAPKQKTSIDTLLHTPPTAIPPSTSLDATVLLDDFDRFLRKGLRPPFAFSTEQWTILYPQLHIYLDRNFDNVEYALNFVRAELALAGEYQHSIFHTGPSPKAHIIDEFVNMVRNLVDYHKLPIARAIGLLRTRLPANPSEWDARGDKLQQIIARFGKNHDLSEIKALLTPPTPYLSTLPAAPTETVILERPLTKEEEQELESGEVVEGKTTTFEACIPAGWTLERDVKEQPIRIGSGAYGQVYSVCNRKRDCTYVGKFMERDESASREVAVHQILSRHLIANPFVVPLRAVAVCANSAATIQDKAQVDAETRLKYSIDKKEPVPEELLWLLFRVVDELAKLGLVHGDMAPRQLLVSKTELGYTCTCTDFGFAGFVPGSPLALEAKEYAYWPKHGWTSHAYKENMSLGDRFRLLGFTERHYFSPSHPMWPHLRWLGAWQLDRYIRKHLPELQVRMKDNSVKSYSSVPVPAAYLDPKVGLLLTDILPRRMVEKVAL